MEVEAVPVATEAEIWNQILNEREPRLEGGPADDEIVDANGHLQEEKVEHIERVRSQLLAMEPRSFELFVRDLLVHCGFSDVCVTKFTADGGIDVNARAGGRLWMFEDILVQVQAKRWMHSVGRKEVAELRGSLQPFARGVIMTTSYFSRAAVNEAGGNGKNPISLVDGFKLSKVVLDEQFRLKT